MSKNKHTEMQSIMHKHLHVCPKCKARNRIVAVSLSTAKPDRIAVLTQCTKNSNHIHVYYYRLDRIEERLKDSVKIE